MTTLVINIIIIGIHRLLNLYLILLITKMLGLILLLNYFIQC